MILSRRPLRATPAACKRKAALVWIVAFILVTCLPGCASPAIATMTLGEWIGELTEKAGIYEYTDEDPYFMNVPRDHPYFEEIQAAVEWQVLTEDIRFEPDTTLTREWAAYTLMNLSTRDLDVDTSSTIKDISTTQFPKHVTLAYNSGLMDLDKHHRFEPKKEMDKTEAMALLDEVVSYINNRTFEDNYSSIEYQEDVELSEEIPLMLNEETGIATFAKDSTIQEGQTFVYEDASGETFYYRAMEVQTTGEGEKEVSVTPVDFSDIIQNFSIHSDFNVDFNDAEITDLTDGFMILDGISESDQLTDTVAARTNGFRYDKTATVNGFKVSYTVNSSKLKVEVKKDGILGSKVYANAVVSNINPIMDFDYDWGKINYGYFKLNFDTTESIGIKTGVYKTLYGDLSEVTPTNLLSKLTSMWKTKKDIGDVEIPLCEIKVPVPNCPFATVTARLQLRIYTSGKAEIALSQEHCYGMEYRDNSFRIIHEIDPSAEAVLRASTSIMAGLRFSADIISAKLADVTLEAGAKALVQTICHLYDAKGNHTTKTTDVSYDVADGVSEGNANALFCGDVKAYWVADIELNSDKTIMGKLGLTKKIVLLDENSGKLIPGMKTHIENGLFVDHCTRKDRIQISAADSVEVSDQIKLSSYHMSLDENTSKTIEILGLPDGYSMSDLIYTPEEENVVTIENGIVYGVSPGSTKVTIATKDLKHSRYLNVSVRSTK